MLTSGIILFLAGLISTIVGIALNGSAEAKSERLAEVGPGFFGSAHPGTLWILIGDAVLLGGAALGFFAIKRIIREKQEEQERIRLENIKMHEGETRTQRVKAPEEPVEPEEKNEPEEPEKTE